MQQVAKRKVSLVSWFLCVTKNDLYGGQQEKQVNRPLLAIGVEREENESHDVFFFREQSRI